MQKKLNGREWQRDKVEPWPEEMMENDSLPTATICGVLREIYNNSSNGNIRLLARTAVSMSKKMAARLQYYYDKSNG